MKKLLAEVMSVHAGSNKDLSKDEWPVIEVELDGIVSDRHRSYVREAWSGDKQPKGTTRQYRLPWALSLASAALVASPTLCR